LCPLLLQVGAQLTFARGSGTLTLFLGNKHATLPVQRLAAAVAPSPAAKVAVGSLPSEIAPKQQVQVVLQVAVLQPFVEPPVMSVSPRWRRLWRPQLLCSNALACRAGATFMPEPSPAPDTSAHQHIRSSHLPSPLTPALAPHTCPRPCPLLQLTYQIGSLPVSQLLPLPLANHRFMVPDPVIAKEAFFESWKGVAAAPQKQQVSEECACWQVAGAGHAGRLQVRGMLAGCKCGTLMLALHSTTAPPTGGGSACSRGPSTHLFTHSDTPHAHTCHMRTRS
jgi:hypothetical protein